MIVYHRNQISAFTGNHVFYFQFQTLFSQVITLTSGPAPAPDPPGDMNTHMLMFYRKKTQG